MRQKVGAYVSNQILRIDDSSNSNSNSNSNENIFQIQTKVSAGFESVPVAHKNENENEEKLSPPSCFITGLGTGSGTGSGSGSRSGLLLGPGPGSEYLPCSNDRSLGDQNEIKKTDDDERKKRGKGKGKDNNAHNDDKIHEGTDKEDIGKEKEKDLSRRRSGANDSLKDRKREREKEVEKAKEEEKEKEMNNSFSGDFLFDYYDGNSSLSLSSQEMERTPGFEKADPGNYHTMRISINEGPALALMDKCLDLAAINCRHLSSGIELRSLVQGPSRRGIVDDITILVVTLQ